MKNIRLKYYIRLPNASQYDAVLQHLNPKNSFAGKQMDTNTMPYANVKYAIQLLAKTNGWQQVQQLFEICFGITEKQFYNARVVEYYAARRFLLNALIQVIETENRMLQSAGTNSHLWHMAGADRLKTFSDTLPLVQLGRLFGQYPYDMGRKPYGEIFSLLAQLKTQNEVEAEYTKLSKS